MIRSLSILLLFLPMGLLASEKQASTQEQLAKSRAQIDSIDRQIVALINQRAAIVQRIGTIKRAEGLPITVPSREQAVLNHVSERGSSGPFPADRLRAVYSTLLQQMRDWEQEQQNPTIRSETISRASNSWDGAEYHAYPSGTPELSLLKITIPPHTTMHWHTHPMPNMAFVLSGEITAEQPDGKQRHFSSGDVIAETVNTVHRGRTGDQTAVLLVFYAGVKGMTLAKQEP